MPTTVLNPKFGSTPVFSVANTAERNAIPHSLRVIGMLCVTGDPSIATWQLLPGPWSGSNSDWVSFGGGGGGSGTVTGISIASANGLAGVSDGNPATPTLTLSTVVTGILLGDGTGVSAVTVSTGLDLTDGILTATGGGGLPTGTAGQSLITDGASPTFSSTVEVYTGSSPFATGVDSTVLNGGLGTASGTGAHADSGGHSTGAYSHADSLSTASGDDSHADSDATASGLHSHANSKGTASGVDSHANSDGIAVGISSHANSKGQANGDYSYSGNQSVTYGKYSHGDSGGTTYGVNSHAENFASAYGDQCHAEGSFTAAGPNAFQWNCDLSTVGGKSVATIVGLDARSSFTATHTAWLFFTGLSGVISSVVFGTDTVITFTTDLGGLTGTDTIFQPDKVTGAHAEGNNTLASAPNSHARGDSSLAELYAKSAQGGGQFSNAGDRQYSNVVLSASTTDATPTILKLGNSSLPLIRDSMTYGFTASIVGRDISGTDHVWWIRKGLIHSESGTVSLAGVVTTVGTDTGTTGGLLWGLAITADNTNKSIQVQVTGAVSTTIHWVCKLECVEVG